MSEAVPARPRVLVLGYGNPGRQDDGLGPALAEALAALSLPGVSVDSDYQLMVDDAASFREADLVVLADAAVQGPEPFFVQRVEPRSGASFTSHGVDGPELAGLARDLFHVTPPVYQLGIRGYLFDTFEERISDKARANLEEALRFLAGALVRDPQPTLEALSRAAPEET